MDNSAVCRGIWLQINLRVGRLYKRLQGVLSYVVMRKDRLSKFLCGQGGSMKAVKRRKKLGEKLLKPLH